MKVRAQLKAVNACHEAVEWASKYETLQEAWDFCPRGDWMTWLAQRDPHYTQGLGRAKLLGCLGEIARSTLAHVTPGEERPARAIEAVEAYIANTDPKKERMNCAVMDALVCAKEWYVRHYPTHFAARTAECFACAAVYTEKYTHDVAYIASLCTPEAVKGFWDERLRNFFKMAQIVRRWIPLVPTVGAGAPCP